MWGSISVYTKNWFVFWSVDKELSSGVDIIGWNFLSKKKIRKHKRKKTFLAPYTQPKENRIIPFNNDFFIFLYLLSVANFDPTEPACS